NMPRTKQVDQQFASFFFFEQNMPLYMPKQLRSNDAFLYWKTEEKKAYTPTYEEARPKVVEAWRFLKAREPARQEVERIQEEVRKPKSQGEGLKYLRDESAKPPGWGEMFYLSEIARLKPSALSGLTRRQYEPYVPDEEKIKAPPGFVDQLMGALKETGD